MECSADECETLEDVNESCRCYISNNTCIVYSESSPNIASVETATSSDLHADFIITKAFDSNVETYALTKMKTMKWFQVILKQRQLFYQVKIITMMKEYENCDIAIKD